MSARVEEVSGGIPAHLAQAFRELNERAFDLSRQDYEPYPNRRFARLPANLQEYLALSEMDEDPSILEQANERAGSGLKRISNEYENYLAPYREQVANKLTDSSNRNADRMVSEVEKIFGVGPNIRNRNLSGEIRQESNNLARRREEEALGRGHQAVLAGFGLDRARELEAAGILNKLSLIRQASRIQDAQTLKETGLLRHDNDQRDRDLAYERWKEEQRHPHESLQEYFNILSGVPYVRSSYEKSEDITPRQSWHSRDWMGVGGDVLAKMLSSGLGRRERNQEAPGRRMSVIPEGYVERAAAQGASDIPLRQRSSQPYGSSSSSSSSSGAPSSSSAPAMRSVVIPELLSKIRAHRVNEPTEPQIPKYRENPWNRAGVGERKQEAESRERGSVPSAPPFPFSDSPKLRDYYFNTPKDYRSVGLIFSRDRENIEKMQKITGIPQIENLKAYNIYKKRRGESLTMPYEGGRDYRKENK